MRFDILVTAPRFEPAGQALLEEAGCRLAFVSTEGGRAEMERRLAETAFDGIVSRFLPISAEAIAASPRLRVISRAAAGYDIIDVAAATSPCPPGLYSLKHSTHTHNSISHNLNYKTSTTLVLFWVNLKIDVLFANY